MKNTYLELIYAQVENFELAQILLSGQSIPLGPPFLLGLLIRRLR